MPAVPVRSTSVRSTSNVRFYKINFILVTTSVLITFAVGMGWWKIIGLY